MNMPKLLPSLMCVDFTRMAQTLEVFEQCGIDALHVEIMDGEFVPNYALGTDFCRQLRKLTPIPLDIHLMISRPDTKLSCFAIQPGEYVSVHWESTPHIHRTIGAIAALGGKPMLAINPATPYDVIRYLLPDLADVPIGADFKIAVRLAVLYQDHPRSVDRAAVAAQNLFHASPSICNFLLYTHTFEKTRANYGFCRKRLFRHFFIDIYCSFLTAMLELQNRVHSVHNI